MNDRISPRQSVALELSDTCLCAGLNESYGVNVSKHEGDKSYWVVTFAKARILDGVIHVYSPNFILVKWQTAIRDMPRRGSHRFNNVADAKKFICDKFMF